MMDYAPERKKKICIRTCIIVAAIVVIVTVAALAFMRMRFDGDFMISSSAPSLASLITADQLMKQATTFNDIAIANGGSRTAWTGFNASLQYVYDTLTQPGVAEYWDLRVQNFTVGLLTYTTHLSMSSPSVYNFTEHSEYKYWMGSPNAHLKSASVVLAQNYGCNASDFQDFAANTIALINRGRCSFQEKASHSMKAGASAVIFIDYENEPLSKGSMYGNITTTVPVMAVPWIVGQVLTLTADIKLDMSYKVSSAAMGTANLIATSKQGNSSNIVVSGSHLDSVGAGPGIDDNASGSSYNLEAAVQMAKLQLQLVNQVQIMWFGAEEHGLVGSSFYLNSLTSAEIAQIACMLNFDMIAGTNYQIGLSDPTDVGTYQGNATNNIQSLFAYGFEAQGVEWGWTYISGRTDSGPFLWRGIPAVALYTGAEGIKTQAQYDAWGGIVGAPYDPCYHQACDTINNINPNAFLWNARAGAYALETLATNTELRDWLAAEAEQPVAPVKLDTRYDRKPRPEDNMISAHEH